METDGLVFSLYLERYFVAQPHCIRHGQKQRGQHEAALSQYCNAFAGNALPEET